MKENKGTYIHGKCQVRYEEKCPCCQRKIHIFISKKSGEVKAVEVVENGNR